MRACDRRSEMQHAVAAANLRLEGCLLAWFGSDNLVGLVADESDNHAVEVEEEHDEVETELDEGFLRLLSATWKSGRNAARELTFL